MALDEAVERARHAGPTPLSIRLRVSGTFLSCLIIIIIIITRQTSRPLPILVSLASRNRPLRNETHDREAIRETIDRPPMCRSRVATNDQRHRHRKITRGNRDRCERADEITRPLDSSLRSNTRDNPPPSLRRAYCTPVSNVAGHRGRSYLLFLSIFARSRERHVMHELSRCPGGYNK